MPLLLPLLLGGLLVLGVFVAVALVLAMLGSTTTRSGVEIPDDPREEKVEREAPQLPHEPVAERIDQYWPIIDRYAVRYGVRQSLVQAVIHMESGGNPRAYRAEPKINDASYGLMQVLSSTARALGWSGTNPEELFDPDLNIQLGTKYLGRLLSSYRSELIALIGYNGGPVAVLRYKSGGRGFASHRYALRVLELAEFYRKWNIMKGRG